MTYPNGHTGMSQPQTDAADGGVLHPRDVNEGDTIIFPGSQPDWLVLDADHTETVRNGVESRFRVRKASGQVTQVAGFHVEAALAGGARVV